MRWCSMKSHERLKTEGSIESYLMGILHEAGHVDTDDRFHGPKGDFLIEINAHYLGYRSKRLTEPAEDVLD